MDEFLQLENIEIAGNIFGNFDENVKIIEKECSVDITTRDSGVKISGSSESVEKAMRVLRVLTDMARRNENISAQTVTYVISMVDEGNEQFLAELGADNICITAKGRPIKPKTLGQKEYVKAIASNTITLGIGPAGTGKTYLAVAMAVTALRNKQINRIILTRPAVEAGEKLGFLPGDLQNKVDPYLRPLNDALFDMLGTETYHRYVEKNIIEIAPLAYMRGRTLARLGFNSKAIITGDITQIDLPNDKKSGLKEAMKILKDIDDIAICQLTFRDVVRHQLVQKIIQAYEKYDIKRAEEKKLNGEKTYKKYFKPQ